MIPKMVKVNLDIEENLHKTIRKEAIDRGITMKAYLLELIEKGIGVKEGEGVGKENKGKSSEEVKTTEE